MRFEGEILELLGVQGGQGKRDLGNTIERELLTLLQITAHTLWAVKLGYSHNAFLHILDIQEEEDDRVQSSTRKQVKRDIK